MEINRSIHFWLIAWLHIDTLGGSGHQSRHHVTGSDGEDRAKDQEHRNRDQEKFRGQVFIPVPYQFGERINRAWRNLVKQGRLNVNDTPRLPEM
jgi:hypothetical protein